MRDGLVKLTCTSVKATELAQWMSVLTAVRLEGTDGVVSRARGILYALENLSKEETRSLIIAGRTTRKIRGMGRRNDR